MWEKGGIAMHKLHQGGDGRRGVIATGLAWILCGLLAREAGAATWYTDQKATGNKDGKSWTNATTTIAAGISKLQPGDTLLVRGDAIYTNESFGGITYAKNGPSNEQHTVVQGVPGEGAGEPPLIWGGKLYESASFTHDVEGYPNLWKCTFNDAFAYDILEVYPAGTYFANIYSNHNDGVKYSRYTNLAGVNGGPGRCHVNTTEKILYVYPHAGTMEGWDVVYGKTAMWQPASNDPGVANITISGFIMKQAYEYHIRFYYANTRNVTISGNTFVKSLRGGVIGQPGYKHGIVVCSNTFINSRISLPGVTNFTISGNTVAQPQTGWSGIGISVSGGSNTVDNNVCCSNTIGILMPAARDGAPVDCAVYNNVCHDNTSYNLQIMAGTNCAVFNNTLYNAGAYGLYLTKTSKNLKVFNNLAWERGSGDYVIYVDAAATNAYSGDYNNFYASDGATFGYFGGAAQADLQSWRAATGQDAHSVSADPRFMSTGTVSVLRDFRLTRSSPCRNAGTASFLGVAAPLSDLEGDARPHEGSCDIGSDEMAFPPPGTLIMVH